MIARHHGSTRVQSQRLALIVARDDDDEDAPNRRGTGRAGGSRRRTACSASDTRQASAGSGPRIPRRQRRRPDASSHPQRSVPERRDPPVRTSLRGPRVGRLRPCEPARGTSSTIRCIRVRTSRIVDVEHLPDAGEPVLAEPGLGAGRKVVGDTAPSPSKTSARAERGPWSARSFTSTRGSSRWLSSQNGLLALFPHRHGR